MSSSGTLHITFRPKLPTTAICTGQPSSRRPPAFRKVETSANPSKDAFSRATLGISRKRTDSLMLQSTTAQPISTLGHPSLQIFDHPHAIFASQSAGRQTAIFGRNKSQRETAEKARETEQWPKRCRSWNIRETSKQAKRPKASVQTCRNPRCKMRHPFGPARPTKRLYPR